MRINHNISAQLANVNLKKVDSRLSASLERLSSGYRINKAADDSAGLAISNKMRTQIKALDQASRNAADGESIIQTAEGALTEIASILQRVRELGVQAANDTYTLDDRVAAQAEIDELLDEIDRISETTEFNGKGLLDGSSARTTMSNSLSVRTMSATMSVKSGTYDVQVTKTAEPATAVLNYTIPTTGTYVIDLNDVEIEIEPGDTPDTVKTKVIEVCDAMNMDVKDNGAGFEITTRATGLAQQISIQYPTDQDPTIYRGADAEVTLGAGFGTDNSYTAVGANVTIIGNNGFEICVDVSEAQVNDEATLRIEDAGYMVVQIGANEHQILEMDFTEINCEKLCLRDRKGTPLVNVCTSNNATHMLEVMDRAIETVSATRSQLGAYQNRLETTEASLDISSENMTDAMSRIRDTDMADEMTKYTQYSVLSQAATSMLSQANNRPQEVMNLLQS